MNRPAVVLGLVALFILTAAGDALAAASLLVKPGAGPGAIR
jgi:hypothetical protein